MIADNYDLWKQHEEEQQEQLEKLPICEYCGKHIQDDYYYEIDKVCICENCLNENFRKDVDNYDNY